MFNIPGIRHLPLRYRRGRRRERSVIKVASPQTGFEIPTVTITRLDHTGNLIPTRLGRSTRGSVRARSSTVETAFWATPFPQFSALSCERKTLRAHVNPLHQTSGSTSDCYPGWILGPAWGLSHDTSTLSVTLRLLREQFVDRISLG